jgi:hypothetical protein
MTASRSRGCFRERRGTPQAPQEIRAGRLAWLLLARINRTAAAATKANGRQDEQDLPDGFLSETGWCGKFVLSESSSSFILSILFILSKKSDVDLTTRTKA